MPRGSALSNPRRIDALGLFPPSKMSGPNGTFESVGTSLNTFDCEYASVLIYMYTILYNILQYCIQYCRDDQAMHWSRMVRSHLQPRISMPCKSKINTPRFLSHFSRRFKHFYFATFSSCSGSKPWSWLLTPHRKLQQATLDRKDNTNHSSRNARTEVPQTNDFTSVILGRATMRPCDLCFSSSSHSKLRQVSPLQARLPSATNHPSGGCTGEQTPLGDASIYQCHTICMSLCGLWITLDPFGYLALMSLNFHKTDFKPWSLHNWNQIVSSSVCSMGTHRLGFPLWFANLESNRTTVGTKLVP